MANVPWALPRAGIGCPFGACLAKRGVLSKLRLAQQNGALPINLGVLSKCVRGPGLVSLAWNFVAPVKPQEHPRKIRLLTGLAAHWQGKSASGCIRRALAAWAGTMRKNGRSADQIRPVTFIPHIAPHAHGSVLCCFGNTQVICTAMIEEGVPRWMKEQGVTGGWLTAEYSMLPASTKDRKARDISKGRLDGRSSEIQRLIGRSLRAAVDLSVMGQRTVYVDCDVLQADGGTRTASITGACVALALAFDKLVVEKKTFRNPLRKYVAAVSAGIFKGEALLDLDYVEDKGASVDANFVMTEDGAFVEIQSAGEEATFTAEQFAALTEQGKAGIAELCRLQREAVRATQGTPSGDQLQALASLFKK